MFDLRSAQLQQEYRVRLRGCYDLQLAEVALRQLQSIPAAFVMPLDKVLGLHLPRTPALDEDLLHSMAVAKTYHQGNRTEVWAERPLTPELLRYAATDVRHLHALAKVLDNRLPGLVTRKS
ncbi:3'-5' exonuclease domain-containing protein [Haematococcus lacustris]|uniref:3'-5' exonuclease domain-containing protein n=1 Tax=Haematococcus lacustris TaxID=44745 RepID=A0A699YRV5_HAELA|nr:3'-5' exonuclease domain-containing protein [Haematococcus lacustris]